jgi:hypothetical protein
VGCRQIQSNLVTQWNDFKHLFAVGCTETARTIWCSRSTAEHESQTSACLPFSTFSIQPQANSVLNGVQIDVKIQPGQRTKVSVVKRVRWGTICRKHEVLAERNQVGCGAPSSFGTR